MRSAVEAGALYADVALLIAESRQAGVEGDKGWGPGPHWPDCVRRPGPPAAAHVCSPEQAECAGAAALKAAAEELGRRALPLSLEVLAVGPACPAGASCPGAQLLELWRLHAGDGNAARKSPLLQPPFLFNALVSHLHFSQISAWLTTTQGKLPFKLVYRGEWGKAWVQVRVSSVGRGRECEIPAPHCSCVPSASSASSASSSRCLVVPLSTLPTASEATVSATAEPASREAEAASSGPRILISCDQPSACDQPQTSCQAERVTFQVGEQSGDLSEEEEEELEHGSRLEAWESGGDCVAGPSTSGQARWRKSSFTEGATPALRPRHRAFHAVTGLPLHSSPAPLKRASTERGDDEEVPAGSFATSASGSFAYDAALRTVAGLRAAFRKEREEESGSSDSEAGPSGLAKSAPASSSLLGSFEECALRGRLQPFGSLTDFRLDLAASGAFCPPHISLPVTAFFFRVSDDDAPSPYLGHCSLDSIGKKGYHIPKKGVFQATLFNPQGTVVKMFVCRYDLSGMPGAHTTFLRQRTFFMPSKASLGEALANRAWLRYLIHLRLATSRSSKLYLHSDIRLLFSRKADVEAADLHAHQGGFELRSFTEFPSNPRYSPRRLPQHASAEHPAASEPGSGPH